MKRFRIILVLLLVSLTACGIDNTMYNARNYFKSAQERPLNASGRPTPQAVAEYTKAIQKCGIVLSEKPDGKTADDALYLMGRALYYKGNSAFQAKDAFESLIQGYPKSKHLPEAHIYLARVMREINQQAAAEALLESFIRNTRFADHHPRALLVLTDFEIEDEDYHRAQFWLERIIKDYRHTKEFKEAFFLFGKNYYMQGDYQRSLEEFEVFLETRGIPKDLKMEAQYYLALNHLELGSPELALHNLRSLVRNEQRPDFLARARVLLGRAYLASDEIESGLSELEEVTTSYPRTENSAAAYYYWGKHLYYKESDLDTAVQHLNRVRTDFSRSELAPLASRMATAINKSKANTSINVLRDLDAWLEYHYLKAESFLDPLALPDSALASYQRVIDQRDTLSLQRDSLLIQIDSLSVVIDSLALMVDEEGEIDEYETDSTDPEMEDLMDIQSEADPEATQSEPGPNPAEDEEVPDPETDLDEPEQPEPEADEDKADEEKIQETESPEDPEPEKQVSLESLRQELSQKEAGLEQLETVLERFDQEILPYCFYSIFSILRDLEPDGEGSEAVYQQLLTQYPRNMYSRAATALKEGRSPRLIDPVYEEALERFDLGLEHYPEAPDSLLNTMQEFTQSDFADLKTRANYRLGWFYSFEEPDTTLAKEYLARVLEDPDAGDFAVAVRRFFDGKKYLLRDSGLEDLSTKEEDAEASEISPADSLEIELDSSDPADSLDIPPEEVPLPDEEEADIKPEITPDPEELPDAQPAEEASPPEPGEDPAQPQPEPLGDTDAAEDEADQPKAVETEPAPQENPLPKVDS